MKRREFIKAGAGGAAVAALPFSFSVPKALARQIAEGETRLKAVLAGHDRKALPRLGVELVKLRGNVDNPSPGDVLMADPIVWEITEAAFVTGIIIFGGKVAGISWSAFASFPRPVTLENGDRMTVNYRINVDGDVMSLSEKDRRALLTRMPKNYEN